MEQKIIPSEGQSFSWENALYALVMLYVSGTAAESISQGSHILRTDLIITASSGLIKNAIFSRLGGVSPFRMAGVVIQVRIKPFFYVWSPGQKFPI